MVGHHRACCNEEACCLPDGTCADLSRADCLAQRGTPQGCGTKCADQDIDCEGLQACCFENGDCQDFTPADCVAAGGVPQGKGTDCASTECPSDEACGTHTCPDAEFPQFVNGNASGASLICADDTVLTLLSTKQGWLLEKANSQNNNACRWNVTGGKPGDVLINGKPAQFWHWFIAGVHVRSSNNVFVWRVTVTISEFGIPYADISWENPCVFAVPPYGPYNNIVFVLWSHPKFVCENPTATGTATIS